MRFDDEADRFLAYLRDLSLCLGRLTMIPAPEERDGYRPLARSLWAYPAIGAFLGAIGGVIYVIALGVGLTPMLSAVISLAGLLAITGARHDKALAVVMDRVAGLFSRSGPAEYQTSGGIGLPGTLAVVLSLGARVGALAAIAEAGGVAAALVAALSLSLAVVVAVSYSAPDDDLDGDFSQTSDRPGAGVALASAVIAIVLLALVLPAGAGAAIIGAFLCGAGMAYAIWRQMDLENDQLVAAAQPITEIVVLLILAASIA